MKAATFPCSVKSATGVHRPNPKGGSHNKKSEIKEKQKREREKKTNTFRPPPQRGRQAHASAIFVYKRKP